MSYDTVFSSTRPVYFSLFLFGVVPFRNNSFFDYFWYALSAVISVIHLAVYMSFIANNMIVLSITLNTQSSIITVIKQAYTYGNVIVMCFVYLAYYALCRKQLRIGRNVMEIDSDLVGSGLHERLLRKNLYILKASFLLCFLIYVVYFLFLEVTLHLLIFPDKITYVGWVLLNSSQVCAKKCLLQSLPFDVSHPHHKHDEVPVCHVHLRASNTGWATQRASGGQDPRVREESQDAGLVLHLRPTPGACDENTQENNRHDSRSERIICLPATAIVRVAVYFLFGRRIHCALYVNCRKSGRLAVRPVHFVEIDSVPCYWVAAGSEMLHATMWPSKLYREGF